MIDFSGQCIFHGNNRFGFQSVVFKCYSRSLTGYLPEEFFIFAIMSKKRGSEWFLTLGFCKKKKILLDESFH